MENQNKEMEKKFEQLDEVIAKHKAERGALIPVLHEAQEIFGYLPYEVQERIADGLGVPMSKVYGVVTFYAQFSLSPKGENHVAVCLGTACYVKGSGAIYNKFQELLGIGGDECTSDRRFSLTASRCIGACGLAPVLTVNEDVYGRLTADDVKGIIEKYS